MPSRDRFGSDLVLAVRGSVSSRLEERSDKSKETIFARITERELLYWSLVCRKVIFENVMHSLFNIFFLIIYYSSREGYYILDRLGWLCRRQLGSGRRSFPNPKVAGTDLDGLSRAQ